MKQELYLNLKTSWQSIWEVVRTWILNNKNTQFKPTGDLPQRRPSGVREWTVAGERVKAIQLERVLKITYDKTREGVTWHTELYFKRAAKSIYTRITVVPQGGDESVEIKPPRIAAMLQKRFGDMNEPPKKRQKGRAYAHDSAVVAGATSEGDRANHAAIKGNGGKKKYDKSLTKDWTQKKAAALLGISERQLRTYKTKPPDAHWPGWEDPVALQQWMNQREDRDLMAQAMSRRLPYRETVTERSMKK